MTELSTRSYMVLGLLAIRDWTTYELAGQMERGFADIWSTSRSMVYEEPKHLAALGLAKAKTEHVGKRTRTRYGITRAGRVAMRRWLAEPGEPPSMQFEGLLKVLLADSGDPTSVVPTLAAAKAWAQAVRETGTEVAAEYAAGDGPFQDRARLVSVSFAFLWDFTDLVARWADWAESVQAHSDGAAATAVFERALLGEAAITE